MKKVFVNSGVAGSFLTHQLLPFFEKYFFFIKIMSKDVGKLYLNIYECHQVIFT